jgi:hypothetical protein
VSEHEVDALAGFPARAWAEPALVGSRARLAVPRGLSPGRYAVAVAGPAGSSAESDFAAIGHVSVEAWPLLEGVPEDAARSSHRFDDGAIGLAGFRTATAADAVTVTLFWQPDRAVHRDWKVFVHLVDAGGATVAQHDGVPGDGLRWTDGWRAGEVVEDAHRIALPESLPPGRYAVRVGLYDERTGERSPVTDPAAPGATVDAVTLGEVERR